MLVICLLNNIVLRGRGFCTSSIAQITGNVPRLLADIVFTMTPGVQLKIPKCAILQCHKLCTSSVHYKLSDMYTDLTDY